MGQVHTFKLQVAFLLIKLGFWLASRRNIGTMLKRLSLDMGNADHAETHME